MITFSNLEGEPNYPIESYKTEHSKNGRYEFTTTGFLMRNVNRNISANRYVKIKSKGGEQKNRSTEFQKYCFYLGIIAALD